MCMLRDSRCTRTCLLDTMTTCILRDSTTPSETHLDMVYSTAEDYTRGQAVPAHSGALPVFPLQRAATILPQNGLFTWRLCWLRSKYAGSDSCSRHHDSPQNHETSFINLKGFWQKNPSCILHRSSLESCPVNQAGDCINTWPSSWHQTATFATSCHQSSEHMYTFPPRRRLMFGTNPYGKHRCD